MKLLKKLLMVAIIGGGAYYLYDMIGGEKTILSISNSVKKTSMNYINEYKKEKAINDELEDKLNTCIENKNVTCLKELKEKIYMNKINNCVKHKDIECVKKIKNGSEIKTKYDEKILENIEKFESEKIINNINKRINSEK